MDTNKLLGVLPDLLVVVRVGEGGSFAAAARALGSTPSAVSRQMARLEQALGSRLLERTTRSLRLTEAGQLAFQHSQAMLESAQAVLDSAGAHQAEPSALFARSGQPVDDGRQFIQPMRVHLLHPLPPG